jgi:hypothetical protein
MDILANLVTSFSRISASGINIPNTDANAVLAGGLNIVYMVAGIIAVIAIIFAGFSYVNSMGDPSAVAKAKNIIMYAVIGLVVIIMAFTVTWFVIGRF